MLVKIADGKLLIRATDDLQYFLSQIPENVDHYKQKESPSMPVLVELTLNGKHVQEVPFKADSPEFKAAIPGVEKQLQSKGSKSKVSISSAKKIRTFYLSVLITSEHQLGKCTGRQIVDDINAQIKSLTEAGFVLSARTPKHDVDEAA